MRNFKLFIIDSAGERIFATKTFKSIKYFEKWFLKNVFLINSKLNLELGLAPVEIFFNKNNTISIINKETNEIIS